MISITILVPLKNNPWKVSIGGGYKSYATFGHMKRHVEGVLQRKFKAPGQEKIKVLVDYGEYYDGKRNEWTNQAKLSTTSDAIDMVQYLCEDYVT